MSSSRPEQPRPVKRAAWLAVPVALMLSACGADVHVTVPAGTTTATSGQQSPSSSSASSSPATSSTSSSATSAPAPTAEQIVQQVESRVDRAKSAHVAASNLKNGTTQTIDIAGTLDGKNQTATYGLDPGGIKAQFRMVDSRVYVNGNAAYYRRSGATSSRADQLAGHWVSVPASRVSEYTEDLTIDSLLRELRDNLESSVSGLAVSPSAQNGQPVWRLTNPATTVIVQGDGSGTLISAEHTDSSGEKSSYVFDQWDAAPTVEAPSNPITT